MAAEGVAEAIVEAVLISLEVANALQVGGVLADVGQEQVDPAVAVVVEEHRSRGMAAVTVV